MRKTALLLIGLSVLFACTGNNGTSAPPGGGGGGVVAVQIALSSVATGLSSPLGMEAAPDSSGRLFIVQQGGRILILQNGTVSATPFLDIASKITSGGETGLLGLAFHPNFATNRKFYLNYTRTNAGQLQTVISEFQASIANPNIADLTTERVLLVQDQPFSNHNGGQISFGTDGFLYIALGDGGSGGDPNGNGQNTQTLLGKILRIDVNNTSTGKQYAIPVDNPFATSGGKPEIFAYGFRNPWRFSFDTTNGLLFAGDVGESSFEEIDIVTKGDNYGWNVMEGTHCFKPSTNCNMTGLTMPIIDYGRSDGSTVIGGYVYRGTAVTGLVGAYVYGDFGSGRIWMLQQSGSTWNRTDLLSTSRSISAFARDAVGELYVIDYSGTILKIVKA